MNADGDDKFIEKYLEAFIRLFDTGEGAVAIQPGTRWWSDIPRAPGVYAVYENGALVYCGETADLNERMRDLRDTRHHTLRRSVGNTEFGSLPNYRKATSKEKFPDELESELDKHMLSFSVKAVPVKLGRKEIEARIISEREPVFNKAQKRGKS